MFQQVSDLANMLRPVATALDLGQSDKIAIADACNIFMNLLNESVLQDHCDKVQKRFDFVLKPCHLVAYKFHPKYLGAELPLEQIETKLSSQQPLLSKQNPFSASFFTARGRGQQPSDMVESLGLIINKSPRWLHRLHGGAIDCSGIICSSGASLQQLWAGTHLAPQQARTPESCKVGVLLHYRILRGPKELDYQCELDILNTKLNFCGHWT